ncbi:MAG: hypothetical protein HYY92_03905 [Parcubacteria group bacterium]|nr:hypothetical protein [Parcubacteria group bacterium]
MHTKAILTFHAYERISERLHLRNDEIRMLLDADPPRTVDIGLEQGTNRIHRLFFSEPDNYCFIAVQDTRTGEVVTVLPMDNRTSGSFVISLEAAEQAKNLALTGTLTGKEVKNTLQEEDSLEVRHEVRQYRIVCCFVCPHTQRQVNVHLGKFPIDMEGEGRTALDVIETSLKNNAVFQQLAAFCIPAKAKGKRLQVLSGARKDVLTIPLSKIFVRTGEVLSDE